MHSSEEEEEGEARMENVDQSSSGTGKEFPSLSPSSPFSSSSFSSFSKDLCYVNRPVAYKSKFFFKKLTKVAQKVFIVFIFLQ